MNRYRNDPYWLTLKYPAWIDGANYPKGTRVFYYPKDKRMLVGLKAEQAAHDFDTASAEEIFGAVKFTKRHGHE